jgi:hypothetical protein
MYVIDEMENYHAQMNKINLKWGFENKNQKRIDPPLDVNKKISKAKWKKRKIVLD